MHVTKTHAASTGVWTYVKGAARKANGNRSHRQEERNSRVAVIGTGGTGASWAAFYVTTGLDVTAHSKKEAPPAMAKAAQAKTCRECGKASTRPIRARSW